MKKFFVLFMAIVLVAGFNSCNKEDGNDGINTENAENNNGGGNNNYNGPTPTAHFLYTQHASLTVDFENNSSNATSFYWEFGDGYTSTQKDPSHTYSTKGEYTVKLTASNAGGSSSAQATLLMHSSIRLTNNSEYPYTVTIDGINQGTIGAGATKKYSDYKPGAHTMHVTQQSGYMFYATEHDWDLSLTAGYIQDCSFDDYNHD